MSEKYASERTAPKYPACGRSHIHLTFNGKLLAAMGTVGGLRYPAVSGRPDAKGNFDYSLERQKIADQGSIPEGEYWIQPSELQENAGIGFAAKNLHGAITGLPFTHILQLKHMAEAVFSFTAVTRRKCRLYRSGYLYGSVRRSAEKGTERFPSVFHTIDCTVFEMSAGRMIAVVALCSIVMLVGFAVCVNIDNLVGAFGDGPPYYGHTTNMDKWANPIPFLIVFNSFIATVS